MPMTVQSGGTNTDKQLVTKKGAAVVSAASRSALADAARDPGGAFIWQSLTYDSDGGDTILLVQNTNAEADLVIDAISFGANVASVWHVQLPLAKVTVAGTTVVGVDLGGGTTEPAATAATDETGNTTGTIIYSTYVAAATAAYCTIIGHFEKADRVET